MKGASLRNRYEVAPRSGYLTLSFAAALTVALPCPAAGVQDPLPPAETLVAGHLEALGGEAALERVQGIQGEGVLVWEPLEARVELAVEPGGRFGTWVELEAGGGGMRTATVYDGLHAWRVSSPQPPRLLEAEELAVALETRGYALGLIPTDIRSRETVALTEMGGRRCYEVSVTFESGREAIECYSLETGLLIGVTTTGKSHVGEIDTTVLIEEYGEFGGIGLATRVRSRSMGQESVMRIESYRIGRIDPATFAMPAEIRRLVDGGRAP